MDWFWVSIYHATEMVWEVWWALVFGFTISGFLQIFVSKEEIARRFGKATLRSMVLATAPGSS
jgi:uncharacterized protein